MFGKISRPVIGFLTGSLVSGNRARVMTAAVAPRPPLEFKIRSSRFPANYDAGLGILTVLGKAGVDDGGEKARSAGSFCRGSMIWSGPAPANDPARTGGVSDQEPAAAGPKLLCDGVNSDVLGPAGAGDGVTTHRRYDFERRRRGRRSPRVVKEGETYPTSEFLSSCHMCNKKLHGKDIYMYKGEKAFCSTECRYRQIVMDECKVRCRSNKGSRSAEVRSSSCSNGSNIFSTGLLVL